MNRNDDFEHESGKSGRAVQWFAREFTLGNLITIAILLATAVSQWAIMGTRVTGVELHQAVIDKRLDVHDSRFDNLNHEFVPRTELQDRLNTMSEDMRDIKTDLRQISHDRH